ncbi:hypothetical protein Pelo_3490 [Pelomyxa schiedti]|nr:hypothetical protein Pelo_3490 [Pelomyxa schiedti]
MASHNRCGASSPARHFVSLPRLATAPLWDWCLGPDSESVFGLLVVSGPGTRSASYYTFGVSPTLMSVTREAASRGSWCLGARQGPPAVVDPDRLVVTKMAARTQSFSLLDVVTGKRRWLLSEATHNTDNIVHRANHKWWLHYYGGLRKRTLVVVNLSLLLGKGDLEAPKCSSLLPHHQKKSKFCRHCDAGCKVKLRHCHQILEESLWFECIGIAFNNYAPDEAVLMLRVDVSQFLLVIDVNNTFTTGSASVLSMTECLFPLRSSSLLMNKANGDRVIICQVQLPPDSNDVVEIAEGVGAYRWISGNVQILALWKSGTSLQFH